MGDQLSSIKAAYLFVENAPQGTDRVLMSVSPGNEMHFLWTKFIERYNVQLVYDDLNPGDWPGRWAMWDRWRAERRVNGEPFDHYRELHLRIHGMQRQSVLCGHERGMNRRNIYEYWVAGQEDAPDVFPGSDVYDVEIDHPPLAPERDVYISPHCKTQGNYVFTFAFWDAVVRALVSSGVTVTVGYDGRFCEDLVGHPCYRKHWGTHEQWMHEVCRHRLVACGNTGTGWLAAACGVPMVTMEPHNSVMADHRYRECGLRNIVEVVDGHLLDDFDNDMAAVASYVAARISHEVGKGPAVRRSSTRSNVARACEAGARCSVNPLPKLRLMADQLVSVLHLPGDVADLGSYRGGTSVILRTLAPDKSLHLFDTWEGNPHDDPLCHHKRGEWAASLEGCSALVGTGPLTWYHRGVFNGRPSTVGTSQYVEGQFCFVYVDMDTYQATRDAIEFFWPRMVPGGKIVMDDYGWEPCAGVKKAADEFFPHSEIGTVYRDLYTYVVTK